jgi:hypothetical protein
LAGALIFDEKICQSAAQFWFGLRDVGSLYSRAVIQRTIDVSSGQWWAKLLRLLTVNSLSYFVKIKY